MSWGFGSPHDHVAKNLLLFQSMQRGSNAVEPVKGDYPFSETDLFERPGFQTQ